MVRSACQSQARFRPVLASEVQSNDWIRTRVSELVVVRTEPQVLDLAVVEIRLVNTRSSFFMGMSGMDDRSFVEVCGALAPLQGSTVELLHFKRCDSFHKIICQNEELAACREELEEAGYPTDLALLGLGNGKLLVRAGLAERAIAALRLRCRATRQTLTSSDLVVSQELKPVVLEQIHLRAPRVNQLAWSEVLEPSPGVRSHRTFVDLGVASSASSAVTRSSTDAHLGFGANHRKRSRQHPQ